MLLSWVEIKLKSMILSNNAKLNINILKLQGQHLMKVLMIQ